MLAHGEAHDASPPPIVGKRRPGPKHPHYGIPAEHWPMVIHRVVENNEPLRTVAQEYGVSHETIRRINHRVKKTASTARSVTVYLLSYDRDMKTSLHLLYAVPAGAGKGCRWSTARCCSHRHNISLAEAYGSTTGITWTGDGKRR